MQFKKKCIFIFNLKIRKTQIKQQKCKDYIIKITQNTITNIFFIVLIRND